MKRLKAMDLGPRWEELLEIWLKLETAHRFKGAVSFVVLLKPKGLPMMIVRSNCSLTNRLFIQAM
jgi:hypothetical protein